MSAFPVPPSALFWSGALLRLSVPHDIDVPCQVTLYGVRRHDLDDVGLLSWDVGIHFIWFPLEAASGICSRCLYTFIGFDAPRYRGSAVVKYSSNRDDFFVGFRLFFKLSLYDK